MTVALEDLRRARRGLEAEPLARDPLDLGLGSRVGADGAGELADAEALDRVDEPLAIAVERERPPGELEPERGRLGVDAVRSTHADRVAVLLGTGDDGSEGAIEALEQERPRVLDGEREGRVEHVRRREAVVEEAAVVAEPLGDRIHEGRNVVVRLPLDLGDPLGRRDDGAARESRRRSRAGRHRPRPTPRARPARRRASGAASRRPTRCGSWPGGSSGRSRCHSRAPPRRRPGAPGSWGYPHPRSQARPVSPRRAPQYRAGHEHRQPSATRPPPHEDHARRRRHAGRGRGYSRGWRQALARLRLPADWLRARDRLVDAARHADRDRPRDGRDARRTPDSRGDDVPLDARSPRPNAGGPASFLGLDVARPYRPIAANGFLRRVFAPRTVWERAKDPAVWRDLVYLLLVFFPLAIATFVDGSVHLGRRRSSSRPSRSRTGRVPGSSSARRQRGHVAGGARLPRRRHRPPRAAPVVPRPPRSGARGDGSRPPRAVVPRSGRSGWCVSGRSRSTRPSPSAGGSSATSTTAPSSG